MLIARLATELHCYIPEELDETWAHLRHLGRRRAQLITTATASAQRIRDFLSVAWPTVTETCAQPLESKTWLAAMQVVTSRCGGQPGSLAAMGQEAFTALVRDAVAGWGGQKAWRTICGRIFAALTDTEGVVVSSRRGLLRRCADELGDLQRTRAQLRTVEADMVAVLGELGLSRLADIPALTAVGVDRVRAHRRADRIAGQVHQHEVAAGRFRHGHPLELIAVERPHHQEVGRDRPLTPGLSPRPVRVIAAHHVQVRARDRTPQHRRIRQQMNIAAPQPAHLAAAQPRTRHQQHDQPVPRRPAAPQQPERLLIAGPVHPPLRLPQPVPRPQPPRHPPVLTAGHPGQVPVIGDLIQQRHQPGRRRPGRHRMHHQPPHRRRRVSR